MGPPLMTALTVAGASLAIGVSSVRFVLSIILVAAAPYA